MVALKMIRSGELACEEEVERFRGEAVAAAALQHPNIAQVYEVGEHGGRPFFSLEYCPGGSLARRLAGTPLPPKDAARLLVPLAEAVAAAHAAGIVHRDLKPGNVLLASDGTPKVADFGLAKQFGDDGGATRSRAAMGTPSYMAPEQAEDAKRVGPAADVYALGAILYECLTGRPPFKGATLADTLLQVRDRPPVPPAQLNPAVPRDLETVCLKCLEKEPHRRYLTAQELADDLRRFLTGRPVVARRAGPFERTWKWCRRNPVATAACALFFLVAVFGVGGGLATWQWRAAEVARADLEDQKLQTEGQRDLALAAQRTAETARSLLAEANGKLSQSNLELVVAKEQLRLREYEGNVDRACRDSLLSRGDVALDLLNDCPSDLRGWEWRYARRLATPNRLTLHSHFPQAPVRVDFSADGTRLLTSHGGPARLWDVKTGELLFTADSGTRPPRPVPAAFSPDGKLVVTGSDTSAFRPQVWDARTGKRLSTFPRHFGVVTSVAFSPDGSRVLSTSFDETAWVWDPVTGREIHCLKGHTKAVTDATFSPDGERVVTVGDDKVAILWDPKTGAQIVRIESPDRMPSGAVFSPDGRLLFLNCDREIHTFAVSADGLSKVPAPPYARNAFRLPTFDTARGLCVTSGPGNTLRVWDVASGREVCQLLGLAASEAIALRFSPDGRSLVSASGFKREVRRWDVTTGRVNRVLVGHLANVSSAAVAPDGTIAASASDGLTRVWDPEGWPGLSGVMSQAFSPDGKLLVAGTIDGAVLLYDPQQRRPRGVTNARHDGVVRWVAFDRDGQRFATAGEDGRARVWDCRTGELVKESREIRDVVRRPLARVAFAPEGKELITADCTGTIRRWNLETGATRLISSPADGDGRRAAIDLSSDGRRAFVAGWSASGAAYVCDARTGDVLWRPEGWMEVIDARFAPDGCHLAVCFARARGAAIELWNVDEKRRLYSVAETEGFTHLAFLPNGTRLLAAGWELSGLRVRDAKTGRVLLTVAGNEGWRTGVAVSPDGEQILVGGPGDVLVLDPTLENTEVRPPPLDPLGR